MVSDVLNILKAAAPLLIAAVMWYPAAIYICIRPRGSKRRYKGKATSARCVYRRDGNILYRRQKAWGRSRS